jgi:hypothetical protein
VTESNRFVGLAELYGGLVLDTESESGFKMFQTLVASDLRS